MEVIDDNASTINVAVNEIGPFSHVYACLTFEGKAYVRGASDRIHPQSGITS
jgi:hypothetical protein